MKGNMSLYYDEEEDFLEINIGKHTEGYFKNIGKGIFERIDKKTKQIKGIMVMGFRKRTKSNKNIAIPLPVKIEMFS